MSFAQPQISAASSSAHTRGYRPDIDGLRALAILSVVAFHVGCPVVGGGFVGVDVFFVISGYLISGHIYRELQGGAFSLRRFYERRTRRILPAFFAVTAVCYVLGCLLLAPGELQTLSAQAIAALTSTSNLFFWSRANYFAKSSETQTFLMTWSLGVEEQFYLLFPVLLMVCRRLHRRKLILLLVGLSAGSLALAVFQVQRYPSAAFFLLPSRWWELGCGTVLGVLSTSERYEKRRLSRPAWLGEAEAWLGLGLLAWAVFGYRSSTHFPGLAAVPPVAAAACLLRAERSWLNRRVLGSKPLVAIGLVSYSWYLWHWPLLSFAHSLSGGPLTLTAATSTAVGALGLASLSYFAIEGPFRRARATRSTLLRYAVATAACMLPAVVLHTAHGFASRYPRAAAIERAALSPDPAICLQQGATLGRPPGLCRPQAGDMETLAILGDSHASALARYLRTDATQHGWVVTEFTKASCPPLGRVARSSFGDSRDAEACYSFNQAAVAHVLQDPHVRRVLLTGFWAAPFGGTQNPGRYVLPGQIAERVTAEQSWDNMQTGLSDLVTELEKHGKTVTLATDTPHYEFNPLLLALDDAIPLRRALAPIYTEPNQAASGILNAWDGRDLRANEVVRRVAARTGAQVLELSAALCHGSTCAYMLQNRLLYFDFNHLSVEGARLAVGDAALFTDSKQLSPGKKEAASADSSEAETLDAEQGQTFDGQPRASLLASAPYAEHPR